jgi:hypothetical protein
MNQIQQQTLFSIFNEVSEHPISKILSSPSFIHKNSTIPSLSDIHSKIKNNNYSSINECFNEFHKLLNAIETKNVQLIFIKPVISEIRRIFQKVILKNGFSDIESWGKFLMQTHEKTFSHLNSPPETLRSIVVPLYEPEKYQYARYFSENDLKLLLRGLNMINPQKHLVELIRILKESQPNITTVEKVKINLKGLDSQTLFKLKSFVQLVLEQNGKLYPR